MVSVMFLVDSAAANEKASEDGNVSSSVYSMVYVSAVEHPEHFWMQMLSERSTQLRAFMQLRCDII